MRITVKVKTGAREEKVERLGDKAFSVWVKELPKEGRANRATVELLSRYFDRPKSSVSIIRGHTSRNKVIEIEG